MNRAILSCSIRNKYVYDYNVLIYSLRIHNVNLNLNINSTCTVIYRWYNYTPTLQIPELQDTPPFDNKANVLQHFTSSINWSGNSLHIDNLNYVTPNATEQPTYHTYIPATFYAIYWMSIKMKPHFFHLPLFSFIWVNIQTAFNLNFTTSCLLFLVFVP